MNTQMWKDPAFLSLNHVLGRYLLGPGLEFGDKTYQRLGVYRSLTPQKGVYSIVNFRICLQFN